MEAFTMYVRFSLLATIERIIFLRWGGSFPQDGDVDLSSWPHGPSSNKLPTPQLTRLNYDLWYMPARPQALESRDTLEAPETVHGSIEGNLVNLGERNETRREVKVRSAHALDQSCLASNTYADIPPFTVHM